MSKTIVSFLSIILLLTFSSCRTISYFESPNHLRNIEGTVHLRNGQSVSGKLVVHTESLLASPVKLYTEGDKKPMQFGLGQILAYSIGNERYELKEIREGFSIGRRLVFMKRLTPESSRLHLYEHMRKEIVNKTATRYHSESYLQLPGESEPFVYATNGAKFVPNFEEKMSRLLSDCPSLSRKIAAKEHGYFYHQVSLLKEKRVEVLLRIINEYNECGR